MGRGHFYPCRKRIRDPQFSRRFIASDSPCGRLPWSKVSHSAAVLHSFVRLFEDDHYPNSCQNGERETHGQTAPQACHASQRFTSSHPQTPSQQQAAQKQPASSIGKFTERNPS